MPWYGFSVLSAVCFAIASLYQKLAMKDKDSDAISSAIIFQFLLATTSALVVPFFGFHMLKTSLWIYALIAGTLYAAGTYCSFRAIKIIEASEMVVFAAFGTIVTLFASYLVLGDRLTTVQWAGAGLILLAIVIVQFDRKSFRFNSGVLFAILGTSMYGLAAICDGYILRWQDTFSYFPIVSSIPAVLLMLTFPKKIPTLFKHIQKIDGNLIIYSIIYMASGELYYVPLKLGALVSQASTILRSSIILTVILAMVFLHERDNLWKKLFGAILTTVGVLLVSR